MSTELPVGLGAAASGAGGAAPASASSWHVSPLVDAAAYHFSWVFILVPLALIGSETMPGWFAVWSVGTTIGFLHRHYTMPYVYLDRQVFLQHWPRFVVVPAWFVVGFVATPIGWRWVVPASFFGGADVLAVAALTFAGVRAWRLDRAGRAFSARGLLPTAALPLALLFGAVVGEDAHGPTLVALLVGSFVAVVAQSRDASLPARTPANVAALAMGLVGLGVLGTELPHASFPFKLVLSGVAVVSGAWNVWHVYMQKFGILRMYAAKSRVAEAQRPPAWVDRLFVFGWIPLYFVVLSADTKPLLERYFSATKPWLFPIADAFIAMRSVLFPIGVAVAAASVGLWLMHERRAYGLENRARLSMALGTSGLSASFLLVAPHIAYMAYGFSHAIEYMVFVWAFQRKRYAAPLPHDPLLGRLLKHPLLAYGSLTLVVGGLAYYLGFGDDVGLAEKPFMILGTKARSWLFYWTIWQSMAHFYFDGFLWKMRAPEVRASL